MFTTSDGAFAVLLAALSTVLAYRFGVGNQLEQLPMILRQLDPSYLTNDIFVSSSATFGPRWYFVQIVALGCRWFSLPMVYVGLQFVSDLAVIAVTMWVAVRVVGTDRLGAMIAAVLTVVVSSIHLGDATELRYAVFQPASLSIPGMLLAIGLGLLERPTGAALAAAVACIPHPLYGAYGAGIGLATAFFGLAADWQRRPRRAFMFALRRTAPGVAIFGVALAVFWLWPARAIESEMSGEQLLAILGRFRSPHHYLPSYFRPTDYVTLAFFLAAGWMAFDRWRRSAPPARPQLVFVPLVIILVGCVAGGVFTEMWTLRAVVTLQPFRLLAVLKFIGFLLFAWVFADWWRSSPTPLARPAVSASLLSCGGAHPLVTAAGMALVQFRRRLPAAVPWLVWVALLGALAIGASFTFGSLNERVRLWTAVALLAAFAFGSRGVRLAAACAALLVVGAAAASRPQGPPLAAGPFQTVFSFDDLRDLESETARAAAQHAPRDAIFVAPPAFGILRLVGRRALVVDFEAMPLQDAHMRAWRERIRDVYGDVDGAGFAARAALDDAYRRVTDEHLRALAVRYGATHAVLYADTRSDLPVVYANDMYRVVRIGSHD